VRKDLSADYADFPDFKKNSLGSDLHGVADLFHESSEIER
jgi:hypothetical protein